MGVTVIAAGVGNAELQLKMIGDLRVTGYVGTPSWLMALIRKSEELGLDFGDAFALRKTLLSAEPLPPDMRKTFVERYNLQVLNAYGTAELGFLAYNIEGGLAMRLLENSIIQVVNPETGQQVGPGESGEVVVTAFNEAYPLIRLGTGDLAMNMDPAPGESRQGERSIVLVGRVGDAVKVRGMFIHPNQLRFAVGQVQGVANFQAVVTRVEHRDMLTLKIVPEPSVQLAELAEALKQSVQAVCRVRVDDVVAVSSAELADAEQLVVDR